MMLNWALQPRYWSPLQEYATGDVLMQMVKNGWRVISLQEAPGHGHAVMYITTLKRDDEELCLLVLDGPAVREILVEA